MLRQILDDVLHSQRLQPAPLQLRPTDLAALVRAVQQLLMPVAASRGLHLHSEIDPMLQQWSLADGLRLRQVLFNLAGNALKFTLQEAWCCRPMRSSDGGQRLRLQVTDTGVGISMERQQAVFAAYEQAETSTTRRFGGGGACRSAASWRHRWGQLHLRSAPGKPPYGWNWCWRPLRHRRWYRCSRRPCNGAARALVVEDHPTNLQLLVQRLRELGLQVHACDDGQQAWEAWQAQPFDLVITDCHMPHMDGFALARAIRGDTCAIRAQVPIVALTASVLERTREACRDAGINHFLAPVAPCELRALLEELLLPDSVRQ